MQEYASHLGVVQAVIVTDPDGKVATGYVGICYFHNYYTLVYHFRHLAEEQLTFHMSTKAGPHPIGQPVPRY